MATSSAEEQKSENEHRQIILITGGNKGIGLSLCKLMANDKNFHVLCTCRNFQRVITKNDKYEWIDDIKNTKNITRIDILHKRFQNVENVDFIELDITKKQSINNALNTINEKYHKIDILINNAGIFINDNNKMIECNYFSTIYLTQQCLSIFKNIKKIINVSSNLGQLHSCIKNDKLKNKLLSDNICLNELNNIIEKYMILLNENKFNSQNDYKSSSHGAYNLSKIGINIYTRILNIKYNKSIWSGCYHPGHCNTFMSKGRGSRPPILAAKGIQLLCIKQDINYKESGKFWTIQFPSNKINDLNNWKLTSFPW